MFTIEEAKQIKQFWYKWSYYSVSLSESMEDYSKERSFTPVEPFREVDDEINLLTENSGRKKKSGEAFTS